MRHFFRNLTGKPVGITTPPQKLTNVLAPETPFFAVGDIHGRSDLLDSLLAGLGPAAQEPIIFLGDYIDRGPDSAGTLRRLFDLEAQNPEKVVCLMGNHERMMLDFIDDPIGKGARWLRFGGLDTLASYGITTKGRPTPDDALDLCYALEDAVPSALIAWLRQLPLCWNSGNMWCVHAAMDPLKPAATQQPEAMLWGHSAFLEMPRLDDACVVHAHTVVDAPTNSNSRIAIDTAAHETGRLTAAHIAAGKCSFMHT